MNVKEIKNPDKNNTEDILALTSMQEGMLFHYLKVPTSDEYVEQLTLEISGEIDVKIFEKAWNVVAAANEMLRTVFRWEKIKHPIQIVLRKNHLSPLYHDLSGIDTSEKNKLVEEIKINDRKKKFDLRDIPFRVTLCKIEPAKYQMIISNHHILYDGWSNGIILDEFFNAYEDLLQKRTPIIPVKNKFKEYIKWLKNQDKNKQEKFWHEYLNGVENHTELAVKTKTGNKQGMHAAGKYHIRLSREYNNKIEKFAKKHRITLAALFYSSWGILLQKYNNSDDVLFGTTVSGRSANLEGIGDMVGLFINTLPLRVKHNPHQTVLHMLNQVHHTLKAREEYESTSLVDISEYSQLGNAKELFDSLVVVENYPLDSRLMQKDSELSVDSYSMVEVTNYDLTVGIAAFAGIDMDFVYNRKCLEPGVVERLSGHFCGIVEEIINNPGKEIIEIDLLSGEEKRQLLVDFNDTAADYPRDKTIHELFAEQVGNTPDYIAVTGPLAIEYRTYMTHMTYISYHELNKKANQLASLLKEKGVKSDTIAAIMVERSLEMIIGILGILKAGGAYLPIDPDYPVERINYILADSGAEILLKNDDFTPEAFNNCPKGASSHLHLSPAPVTSLAYIMYTSGSTGRPKGVLVDHVNVIRLVINTNYVELTGETRILQTGAPVFDATTFEIWGTLLNGGQLVLVSNDIILNAGLLGKTLAKYKISTLWLTSPLFNQLVQQNSHIFSGLKYLLVGGDVLSPQTINRVRDENKGLNIINGYGPTENTTFSTTYLVDKNFRGNIPIGKPISNSTAYILDRNGCLQPVGVYGELFVGGDGVARGYLNNPELTTEKFCLHWPGGTLFEGTRGLAPLLYRTGDLARWLPDGNIEFLGRIDQQVKIRGFRVELGEIESYIRKYRQIKETVVLARKDQPGEIYLCAYIVTKDNLAFPGLRDYLSSALPDFMVPAYFVPVDKIPLTPNGKVNRKALPAPEIKAGRTYAAPTNEIEKQLVTIWAQILGRDASHASQLQESIGIDDNFFEIGGHSLKATRLIGRIHQTFDIEVPLTRLFQTPTVRGLYHYIKKADPRIHHPIDPAEKKEHYPLSSDQKRLYLLQQMNFNNISYNIPQVFLMDTEPNRKKIESAFSNLVERHESFKTSFQLVKGTPVQRIHRHVEFEIGYYCAERMAQSIERNKERCTPGAVRCARFIRPFDLSQAPLLRVALAELEERYLLMVDMHHIISDGASMTILLKEFAALYANTRPQLPALRVQYKDYSEWWRKEKNSPSMKQQEAYWLDQFKKEIPVLTLPTDYKRPVTLSFVGNTINFTLDKKTEQQLNTLALEEGASLFMVLLAVFNVLLAKISGQDDIVVGIGTEGRRHENLRQIAGMFVNTLAFRNTVHQNMSFKNFLGELKQRSLDAFENREYPFEDLVEKLSVKRDSSRNPLFDVMFQFNNLEIPKIKAPGLKLETYQFERQVSKFDLTLWANEEPEKLLFAFEYGTKLFKRETIDIVIRYFKEIVSSAITNPDKKLWEIKQISPENKKKLVSQLNHQLEKEVKEIMGKSQVLQHRLNETRDKFMNRVAIEYGTIGTTALTYKELHKRSDAITHRLNNQGIKKGTFVGILMNKSMVLIYTIVGILKAGCVFVPLDSSYPANRLAVMIAAASIKFILTDQFNFDMFHGSSILHGINEDVEWLLIDEQLTGNRDSHWQRLPNLQYQADDKIYIYFTSGTTGTPKAILGKNISLMHFIDWEINTFAIEETFRFSQLTTPGFDVFLRDVFVPLCCGGVVCIPGSKQVLFEAEALLNWLERSGIHLISCVPSLFRLLISNQLSPHRLSELKVIILSGERITASDLEEWFETFDQRIKLVNMWGPSETTMVKTFHFIKKSDLNRERIPVGQPMRGASVMVLNENLEICDPLVTGELYIRTPFRSFGYYNDSQGNRSQFTRNPFHDSPGDLLFKTGDLGRILPDGTIDFLGRNDRQVKIRGIRIELEEIESVLLKHPSVIETVVIKKERPNHNEFLCAFIVEKELNEPTQKSLTETLKRYLSERLPEYIVPAAVMQINKIPETPNGKIDYKALHAYKQEKPDAVAPQNYLQQKLLQLWTGILKVEGIGIKDNFFTLGGNSLNVMTLISGIFKDFSVRIPLGDIFTNPTIEQQALVISKSRPQAHPTIEPVEKKEYYSAASAQKRLYALYLMAANHTAYNMPQALFLEGELSKERLEMAFREMIRRHESFRTSFEMLDDEVIQRIHDQVQFEIEYYQVEVEGKVEEEEGTRGLAPLPIESAARNSQPAAALISSFIRPFDLSHAPLLRVGMIALRHHPRQGTYNSQQGKEHKYILVVDMHHIISDGVSTGILLEEFVALYTNTQLPGLRLRYKDYSEWQNKTNDSKRIKQQEEYWLKQFAGEIPVLNLPIDYPRPTIKSFAGNHLHFEIGEEDTKALKSLALKEEVTLFMLLLSITDILLSKLSSQEEVMVGTPIAARQHADLQDIIGMFVNTLVLQNRPDGEKTFKQFLNEVKKRTLGAYENQEYPFEKLAEKVDRHKDSSRNPMFDVIFVLQNMENPQVEIPGLKLKPCEYENKISKFDLTFNGVEKKGRLVYIVEYCTSLFKEETILRFIKCFKNITAAVIEKPGQKISGISIIPEDEKRRILYGFNDTKADYPKDKTIYQLFKDQVKQTPDNIAVVGPQQTKNKTYMTYTTHISYHELNEKSNQLTCLLKEKGVKPDTITAIMMERTLEMVIGLLGILNAGGAYLPIDPEYPEERITYMLKDSNVGVLVTTPKLQVKVKAEVEENFRMLPPLPLQFINLRTSRESASEPSLSTLTLTSTSTCQVSPANLAYVIYTSGSTGRPRGVMVQHHSLVNLCCWHNTRFSVSLNDRAGKYAGFGFDASVWEIFPYLICGASIYIIPEEIKWDTYRLIDYFRTYRITIAFLPTQLCEQFMRAKFNNHWLRVLLTGGDKLKDFIKCNYVLVNNYGPTENTVVTTNFVVENSHHNIPIGSPIFNIQIYILNKNGNLQPIGVLGELCISGDGLARGYLNHPGLTAEKFCLRRPGALFEKTAPGPRKNFLFEGTRGLAPLLLKGTGKNHMQSCNHASMQYRSITPQYPIPPFPHSPIYRTGDLARWLRDGNIEFLGRIDHQVKIRGFRIELSEIERNLLTHEGVKEAVVAVKEGGNHDKYLCAYIVSHPGGVLAEWSAVAKELRAHLSQMLPHYMVPTYFVQLQQVPITLNGKVDRNALPEPDIGDTEQENIPPRSQVEQKLVEIWSHVLGIGKDKISIAANFFEIGGHSLNAEMVRSRIHKELNVKLPLAEIFKSPTIKELSPKIQAAEKSEFSDMEPVELKEYYELSYNQKRLWFLHCLDPANLSYHIPGWLRFRHKVNVEALQRALPGILSRHDSFRTGFKKIHSQPVQFVREKTEISLQTIDISRLTENEKQQKTKEIIKQITAQPFDLENPPLFRSTLIKQEDEAFLFVYNMHHIISDGWSMGIVRHEFYQLYNEYAKGNQRDPEPVPYQYKDFAAWHNKQIRDSELRRTALHYWKKVIETGLPVLKLPYYYSGSPEDKSGARYRRTINQTSKEKLLQLAKNNHTTLSNLLFTLYNLLLAYLSGQKEIVTTIISAGRVHSSLDMVVGYFINPVFVKIYVDLRGDFEELLSGINRQVLEALQHQNYPFELLLDDLKIAYPNIPVSFNFISMQDIDMEIDPDSLASHHIREKQEVKFPLGLFLTEYKNGIEINWEYQKTMFEPGTIENTAEKYLDLIVEVTEIDE